MIKSNLKVLLAMHDMDQKDLAERIDVPPLTISKFVNNKFKVYPAHLLNKICKELNCDIKDLLRYIPNETNNKREDRL